MRDKKVRKAFANEKEREKALKTEKYPKKPCTVCAGKGTLPPKKAESLPVAMITKKRKCPHDWKDSGPIAYGLLQMEKFTSEDDAEHPFSFLQIANTMTEDKAGVEVPLKRNFDAPMWFPANPGEQLCNLVGTWRILQKIGSHRWTTDDILTAYIAKTKLCVAKQKITNDQKQPLRYLDLGCGNASVLQMVCWSLWEAFDVNAFGIEARSEAVNLARRSLAFNLEPNSNVTVINADFREIVSEGLASIDKDRESATLRGLRAICSNKFDLVTGTPPYFRVDFTTKGMHGSNENRAVTSAVINQGGMPTAMQSAPARCEFRGGIEAYCEAASSVLSDEGIFVSVKIG
jgi:tRNA1(Val) A37 N6-methylase TrmN6